MELAITSELQVPVVSQKVWLGGEAPILVGQIEISKGSLPSSFALTLLSLLAQAFAALTIRHNKMAKIKAQTGYYSL